MHVSNLTLYRICRNFEETGNVDPIVREYTKIKIAERVIQVILSLVFSSLDLYLTEIKDKVRVFDAGTGKDAQDCIRRYGYPVQGQTRGQRRSVISIYYI